MKKFNVFKTVLGCSLAALILTATSCSEDYVVESKSKVELLEQSKLISDLAQYNKEIITQTPITRSKTSTIVIADIKGAYNGGKIGYNLTKKYKNNTVTIVSTLIGGSIYGDYCSWKANKKSNKDNTPTGGLTIKGDPNNGSTVINPGNADINNIICTALENGEVNTNAFTNNNASIIPLLTLDEKLLASVKLTKEQLNIGKLHNVLLAAFENKISLNDACKKVESCDSIVNMVINSKEIAELCNKIGTPEENSYFYVNEPLPDKVIELFNEIFQDAASDYDTVVRLINKYSEEIDKTSKLTEDQKTSIKNGLSTALYSFNYWHNN